jgi:hypothetical protein
MEKYYILVKLGCLDVMAVLDCGKSKAYRTLDAIRQQYGITKPKVVTLDHFCIYIGITAQQFNEKHEAYFKRLKLKNQQP